MNSTTVHGHDKDHRQSVPCSDPVDFSYRVLSDGPAVRNMDLAPNKQTSAPVGTEHPARKFPASQPEDHDFSAQTVLFTVFLFFVAGLMEIGGGWCVWQWLRESKSFAYGIFGFVVLALYGVVPTFQPEGAGAFYRVYAAYGCWFIVLSLFWGMLVDGNKPDLGDWVGCVIAFVGALAITFWPWRK